MKTSSELRQQLLSLDRKSYPAYKALAGQYDFGRYTLCIDHVQGDPFAAPSHLRIVMPRSVSGFPAALTDAPWKKTALEDQVIRLFSAAITQSMHRAVEQSDRRGSRAGGSGKSGLIFISKCGQEILSRTAAEAGDRAVTVRFEVGFPAAGRTILARELEKILFLQIPFIVEHSMFYANLDHERIERAVKLAEDQHALRCELAARGLAAFVADGAILPRESGISERPLKNGIPFQSPESLSVSLNLPNKGVITGMGIPEGITLIVGGGYHGKSTLLKALERGVYDHIAGDGREYVVCQETAVKIRAEDGRSICKTDISAFIRNLPNGKDTTAFSTENASGSTSQAANIAEALSAGSRVLLIDEDTSATNFMIRDEVMQALIAPDKEPITPFTDLIRPLYEQFGVSTILVVGSSGSYFKLADTVLQMDAYRPGEITAEAKAVWVRHGTACAGQAPVYRNAENQTLVIDDKRCLGRGSLTGGDRGLKIKAMGRESLSLNRETINLHYVEQLADSEQLTALGYILAYLEEHCAGKHMTLSAAADMVIREIEGKGLAALVSGRGFAGALARPRKQEILACLNRLRTLRIEQ